ncbi:ATP-NAD kinase-like domain-containing protein [Xylaria palmicola]|nr:ATP-NAD kinase-like domain-containing protein [Xylaria palmicola]
MALDNPASQPEDDQEVEGLPNPEEVICVLKEQPDTYEVLSLGKDGQGETPFFQLRRSTRTRGVSDENANRALEQLLSDFGINNPPLHLQPSPQRRIHVVVSTHSGTGLSLQFYENVLAPLLGAVGLTASAEPGRGGAEQHEASYHPLITQDADSVKKFAQHLSGRNRAEEGVEHTVVLLSGDGGIVDMLNGYVHGDDGASSDDAERPGPPLVAILPLGTGNALFSSLHKTATSPAAASDLVQGLRTLLRGQPAPLPSFKAVFPEGSRTIAYPEAAAGEASPTPGPEEQTARVAHLYGVVVASYGFHSQLVWESDTPAYRRHGAARFQMVAQELLKESHAYRATVEVTRADSRGRAVGGGAERLGRDRHAYVLATPVSNLEKTFCISPASRPLDGQLQLVHFGPVDGAKTMEIMMAAYDGGKHVGMRWGGTAVDREEEDADGVGYESIGEVRITTHEEDARWRKVCIDGTIVEIPSGGCMVVRKEGRRHLRVLVDASIIDASS